MWPFTSAKPKLNLGTIKDSFPLLKANLLLPPEAYNTHCHLMGVAGVGKSKMLEGIFLQHLRNKAGVSLIDPHSDSAEALLANLASFGFFNQPDAYQRLIYVEFSDNGWYLPFNVLRQDHLSDHEIVGDVLEAMHRAWPSLSDSAAQFDTLVKSSTWILTQNQIPLPGMQRVIADASYREEMMKNVTSHAAITYFRDFFDHLRPQEQALQSASTLRRIFLLTEDPILENCLGQQENAINIREVMDKGQAVIWNLGHVHNASTRRLLGCLITRAYESAAHSRDDLPHSQRVPHFLLIDEFSEFSAQSEQALSDMLSQTRKFGLFATMAHQTWGQLSGRLQGALQNVQVKILMRVGRDDAEEMSRWFGVVNPDEIKQPAPHERSHDTFRPLQEQWEMWVQAMTDLEKQTALVRVGNKKPVLVITPKVPVPKVTNVERIKNEYRRRLMKQASQIKLSHHEAPQEPAAFNIEPL